MDELHTKYKPADPGLQQYLSEISTIPLLTVEEEKELAVRIKEGDSDALQKMVVSNLRFVVTIAKKYRHCCHEMDLLDLVNEGNKGLIEAAKRFDPEKNIKFISYAVWWIRQAILHAITEKCGIIRIPSKHFSLIRRIRLAYRDYEQEHGEKPSLEEIAEKLDIKVKELENTLKMFLSPISLDSPMGEDDGKRLGDMLQIEGVLEPDKEVILKSLKRELKDLLDKLTPREKKIIEMRFGLTGDAPRTLESIGKQMGLSRERVRQIEEKAKKKLGVWAKKKKLLDYLN